LFRITGLPVGEREAPDWFTFVHPDDLAEATMIRDAILSSGVPGTFEHRIVRTDGVERRVRAIVQAQPVAGGMRLFGTVQDVTELRAMQEQLQQAQRLDSIGRLAGGIAHDFNNLLTVINGYSKLLLQKLGSQPDIRADVEQIAEAGREAAELTKRLLAFGRKQVLKPTSLDLAEVMEQTLPLLRRVAGGNVRIETRFEPKVILHADRVQMNQVFLNLTANARDAMPNGGVLTFEGRRDEGFAVLSVSDTGEGMSAAVMGRIFEPFFSTKERSGGTGLGLSSVYGIVLQSGGTIQCFSEPGKGTRFEIRLPATAPTATAGVGSKRILVVDEQVEVREFVLAVLSKQGYDAVGVTDGQSALEALARPDSRWDLLLANVAMPDMTGPELVSRIRKGAWGGRFPVLFLSDHTGSGFDFSPILEKPFSPEALLEAVEQAIIDVAAKEKS
jgi:signal transduction histidine kinase